MTTLVNLPPTRSNHVPIITGQETSRKDIERPWANKVESCGFAMSGRALCGDLQSTAISQSQMSLRNPSPTGDGSDSLTT